MTFESYGVRVTLNSEDPGLFLSMMAVAKRSLLGKQKFIENADGNKGVLFEFECSAKGEMRMFQNGKLKTKTDSELRFFKYFDAMLRLAVAEHAVDTVFLHAGVVGWKGKAVVLPAGSNRGKSTLVSELIRNGAEYLSDEYAVFDRRGWIHPFPRDLAMRNWDRMHTVTSVPPEQFGATVRKKKARAGAVLFAEYRKGAKWNPQSLSIGLGIMEALPHALPLHADTKLSMEVLNKGFESAIIAKSLRGDARKAAIDILEFLDIHLN